MDDSASGTDGEEEIVVAEDDDLGPPVFATLDDDAGPVLAVDHVGAPDTQTQHDQATSKKKGAGGGEKKRKRNTPTTNKDTKTKKTSAVWPGVSPHTAAVLERNKWTLDTVRYVNDTDQELLITLLARRNIPDTEIASIIINAANTGH